MLGMDGSITYSYNSLPAHWSLNITILFWKIDAWNYNNAYFYLDGTLFGNKEMGMGK
jgi:hypothetical protein